LEQQKPAWQQNAMKQPALRPYLKQKSAPLITRHAVLYSRVLNWMIEGLDKIRADGWQLNLTSGNTNSRGQLALLAAL
jgi:hypothetical protein